MREREGGKGEGGEIGGKEWRVCESEGRTNIHVQQF